MRKEKEDPETRNKKKITATEGEGPVKEMLNQDVYLVKRRCINASNKKTRGKDGELYRYARGVTISTSSVLHQLVKILDTS